MNYPKCITRPFTVRGRFLVQVDDGSGTAHPDKWLVMEAESAMDAVAAWLGKEGLAKHPLPMTVLVATQNPAHDNGRPMYCQSFRVERSAAE